MAFGWIHVFPRRGPVEATPENSFPQKVIRPRFCPHFMNSPCRPTCRLVAIALLLLAGQSVFAAKEVQGVLRVEMSRSGGSWVLKSLPTKEDVGKKLDAELRADLQKAIEAVAVQFRAHSANTPAFALFSTAVTARMAAKYPKFALQRPPDSSGDSGFFELRALYDEPAGPVHIRKPLEMISVTVRGSEALAGNPVLTTLGELESHTVPGLPTLSKEDRKTAIFVGASEDDVAKASSSWGNSSDHAAAFEIAAFAFASAQTHNLQGSVSVPEAGLSSNAFSKVTADIEHEVTDRYGLPGWRVFPADRKGVLVKSDREKTDPWTIDIALQAVESVKFHIQGVRMEGQVELLERYPSWAQKLARLEEQVTRDQRVAFDSLRGRLVTKEEFGRVSKDLLDRIEQEKKIVAAGVDTADNAIVFTALYQPRITDLKAGGGYSTDKQLAGTLSLTSQNAWGDDSLLKLAFTAGMEKQEGEFSFGRPFFHRRDSPFTSKLDIAARYVRDDDQKLGMPAGVGLDEEQYSITVGHTLEYRRTSVDRESEADRTKPPESPIGHSYFAQLATSTGLSDTRLGAPDDLKSQVESGQVLFLQADFEQQWNRKLRMRGEPGLGETGLLWNVHLKKGFEAGPGDFDFFAAQTAATTTVYLGNVSSRDFLIRLTLGGAVVTGNSPVFEEFRLGGDSTVRGLEYGERIARGAIYNTVQAGITVDRLISGITQVIKKDKAETPAAKTSGETQGGLDLTSIYLNIFFDYAYITRRGSRDSSGTRSLETVGISLEMRLPESARNGSIEFGYAWSPDSTHDHGRIFTSARFDLF